MDIWHMTQANKQKQCCVRLPEELHRGAKLQAYKEGLSLQEWLIRLIVQDLSDKLAAEEK